MRYVSAHRQSARGAWRGVRQELSPRSNRFQYAVLPFCTECLHGDAAHDCDEEYQRGRAVRRQVVGDEDPARLGVCRDGLLDMGREVGFIPRLLYGRCDDCAGCNLEVADECLRAVPLVFELILFGMSGDHGPGRGNPFGRLNAGLLIDAQRMNSLLFQPLRRRPIRLADITHLLVEDRHVFRIGVEPVAALVWLEFRCLLKNVRLVGRKSWPLCLV